MRGLEAESETWEALRLWKMSCCITSNITGTVNRGGKGKREMRIKLLMTSRSVLFNIFVTTYALQHDLTDQSEDEYV